MTEHLPTEPNPPDDERELALVGERLERSRPVPSPTFRGDLRRRLLSPGRQKGAAAGAQFRLWAAGYTVAGALCLALAAIGLVGAGPFAA
jgi:hypothetical protein